jgi:lysophospholipase L1-like esterase
MKILLKDILKKSFFILFGLLIACLLIEVILRIYNPFQFRVRGNSIVLPINKQSVIQNNKVSKIDRTIIHTTNSLGFRGEEPPGGEIHNKFLPLVFDQYLTILASGGSTTECYFLSDGYTWPEVLGDLLKQKMDKVWVNNAGFVGHTTFGHLILMRDYIVNLKPKVVLFLVGLNDLGIIQPSQTFDSQIMSGGRFRNTGDSYANNAQALCFSSFKCFYVSLANYSEFINLAVNLYRNYKANDVLPGHAKPSLTVGGDIDEIQENLLSYTHIPVTEEQIQKIFPDDSALLGYKERLRQLIQISRDNGIDPIFITQPTLYGKGADDVTGVNLETIALTSHVNGYMRWKLLEKYNAALKDIGKEKNVLVIDLADKMPKSSRYYYDFVHYTNEGARKVAEIIEEDLYPYLSEKYKQN